MINNCLLTGDGVEVDLSIVNDLAGNDNTFSQLIVQTFLDNSPSIIERLKVALINKDWEEVYKAAHFAKSSLSVIRIKGLLEHVQQLETYAKQKTNLDKIPGMIDDFESKISSAMHLLAENFKIKANFPLHKPQ